MRQKEGAQVCTENDQELLFLWKRVYLVLQILLRHAVSNSKARSPSPTIARIRVCLLILHDRYTHYLKVWRILFPGQPLLCSSPHGDFCFLCLEAAAGNRGSRLHGSPKGRVWKLAVGVSGKKSPLLSSSWHSGGREEGICQNRE